MGTVDFKNKPLCLCAAYGNGAARSVLSIKRLRSNEARKCLVSYVSINTVSGIIASSDDEPLRCHKVRAKSVWADDVGYFPSPKGLGR